MAWIARLESPVQKDPSGLRLWAEIGYYDSADTAFEAKLHSKMFQFEPTTTNAQIQQTIADEGRTARASVTRVTNLNLNFPVGTTINIP
ncbi:MAG: hypothetical protein K0R13_3645 [Propionibacteriaceae bacterium]|jgi:hypothetical protein|nr:hypothetical protein [Propionibacteriaceae bacterium]